MTSAIEMEPPPPTNLERRVKAAQATVDSFKDKPFSFEHNRDCAKMALFMMHELGVKPIAKAKIGSYKTATGAKAALRRIGVNNLSEFMDLHFERIGEAFALPGDIIELEGEESPIGALGIALGNGLVLVYHEEAEGAVVGKVNSSLAAWRILPL